MTKDPESAPRAARNLFKELLIARKKKHRTPPKSSRGAPRTPGRPLRTAQGPSGKPLTPPQGARGLPKDRPEKPSWPKTVQNELFFDVFKNTLGTLPRASKTSRALPEELPKTLGGP